MSHALHVPHVTMSHHCTNHRNKGDLDKPLRRVSLTSQHQRTSPLDQIDQHGNELYTMAVMLAWRYRWHTSLQATYRPNCSLDIRPCVLPLEYPVQHILIHFPPIPLFMSSSERRAELNRLLHFFDHLASRGKRRDHPQTSNILCPPTASDSPITKRNKLLEYATTLRLPALPSHLGNRPRRATLSGSIRSTSSSSRSGSVFDADGGASEDEISVAKFPLNKDKSFTFRLGLHKLYERDDWIKKVRESLEQSKKEYKPLSECLDGVRRSTDDARAEREVGMGRALGGKVHFAAGAGLGRPGGLAPRHTSMTLAASGARPRSISAATPSLTSPSRRSPAASLRPVKKRCIGRRKSLNELGKIDRTQLDRVGTAWVYDALVSRLAHEQPQGREARRRTQSEVEEPARVRKISMNGGPGTRRGMRKRAMTAVSSTVLIEEIEQASLKRRHVS